MSIFNKGKIQPKLSGEPASGSQGTFGVNNNKQPQKSPTVNFEVQQVLKPANIEIKILGTSCPRCKSLEKAVYNVVAELNITADISKVEDIAEIMNYGVMSTPALVINGKVVIKGRVPSVEEIKSLLTK